MRIITKDILKMYEQYLINDEKANLTVEKYMRDVLHFYTPYFNEYFKTR